MLQRCFFLADEVEPPLAKLTDIVLMVPRREGSAWLTLVQARGWYIQSLVFRRLL